MKTPKEERIADAPLNPPLSATNGGIASSPDFWVEVLKSGATPPKSGAKVAHCEATCKTQMPENKGENMDSGASGAFLHITNINHRTHCTIPYREAQWPDAPLPPLSPSHMVSTPAPSTPLDDYALAEREAIQAESEKPLADEPDVPGFDGSPNLTAAQHGVIVRQSMGITTPATTMQHSADMARQSLYERVICSACVRFQAGPQPLAIGRCLASADGLPPSPRHGDYRAAYPMAKRHCCEFMGVSS